MPIKKWNKIQLWKAGYKWNIHQNLKTNPDDLKLSDPTNPRAELIKDKIALMNMSKLMKWITWWRKRKYTPEELIEKVNEYFLMNMIFETQYDNHGNKIWEVFTRMRWMSIYWLCNHLEISYSSWRELSSTQKYGNICLQAKQKIMDAYIVWWLEWHYDSRVSSVIVNMQMQNERIEAWLKEWEDWKQNLFQNFQINVVVKNDEQLKKLEEPINIVKVVNKNNNN